MSIRYNQQNSINNYIDIISFIDEILQQTIYEPKFPQTLKCPICKKIKLLIMPDYNNSGYWHYCINCKSGGDIIELAAKVLKMPIYETIKHLNNKKIINVYIDQIIITNYINLYLKRRNNALSWWQKISKRKINNHSDLNKFLKYVQMAIGYDLSRWPNRFADILGAVSQKELYSKIPDFATAKTKIKHSNINWKFAWICPLYDAPGRISNFSIFTKNNITLTRPIIRDYGKAPPGVSYIDNIFIQDTKIGPKIFLFMDLNIPIQTQIIQKLKFDTPLPVIGALRESDPCKLIKLLTKNKKLILIDRIFDKYSAKHAKELDAYVYIMQNENEFSVDKFAKFGLRKYLKSISAKSVHWKKALADIILKSSSPELIDLLEYLKLSNDEIEEIISANKNKELKLRKTLETGQTADYVITSKGLVIQQNDSWWVIDRKGKKLISNFTIKIINIIKDVNNEILYDCEIVYKGKKFKSVFNCDYLHEAGFLAVSKELETNDCSPTIFNMDWKNRAVELAKLFHTPKISKSIIRIGWNEKSDKYVWPSFAILSNGESINVEYLFPKHLKELSLMPGELSRRPLSKFLSNNKTKNQFNQLIGYKPNIIVLTALSIHNIICQKYKQEYLSAILNRNTIAEKNKYLFTPYLGISTIPKHLMKIQYSETIFNILKLRDLPVLVKFKPGKLLHRLINSQNNGLILYNTDQLLNSICSNKNGYIIMLDDDIFLSKDEHHKQINFYLKRLVPFFVQKIIKEKIFSEKDFSKKDIFDNIVDFVSDVINSDLKSNINNKTIKSTYLSSNTLDSVLDLFCMLINKKIINAKNEEAYSTTSKDELNILGSIMINIDKQYAWIPSERIDQKLTSIGYPSPDWKLVKSILTKNNLYIYNETIGSNGFLVNFEFCKLISQKLISKYNQSLSIT